MARAGTCTVFLLTAVPDLMSSGSVRVGIRSVTRVEGQAGRPSVPAGHRRALWRLLCDHQRLRCDPITSAAVDSCSECTSGQASANSARSRGPRCSVARPLPHIALGSDRRAKAGGAAPTRSTSWRRPAAAAAAGWRRRWVAPAYVALCLCSTLLRPHLASYTIALHLLPLAAGTGAGARAALPDQL